MPAAHGSTQCTMHSPTIWPACFRQWWGRGMDGAVRSHWRQGKYCDVDIVLSTLTTFTRFIPDANHAMQFQAFNGNTKVFPVTLKEVCGSCHYIFSITFINVINLEEILSTTLCLCLIDFGVMIRTVHDPNQSRGVPRRWHEQTARHWDPSVERQTTLQSTSLRLWRVQ